MKTPQNVHLSIDDVSFLFLDLIKKGEHYKSVFQSPLLKFLQVLHLKYKASFTLFGYFRMSGHTIREIPDKFRDEFKTNASWLKFGFHWIDDNLSARLQAPLGGGIH